MDSAVLSVCTSAGDERPLALGADETRSRAIRPMFVLAQIHVEAEEEGGSQNRMQRLKGDALGDPSEGAPVPRPCSAIARRPCG
jgi:hypothetical protein